MIHSALFIQREASTLLFLLRQAMREPLSVERAIVQAVTLFRYLFIPEFGEPIGDKKTTYEEILYSSDI